MPPSPAYERSSPQTARRASTSSPAVGSSSRAPRPAREGERDREPPPFAAREPAGLPARELVSRKRSRSSVVGAGLGKCARTRSTISRTRRVGGKPLSWGVTPTPPAPPPGADPPRAARPDRSRVGGARAGARARSSSPPRWGRAGRPPRPSAAPGRHRRGRRSRRSASSPPAARPRSQAPPAPALRPARSGRPGRCRRRARGSLPPARPRGRPRRSRSRWRRERRSGGRATGSARGRSRRSSARAPQGGRGWT